MVIWIFNLLPEIVRTSKREAKSTSENRPCHSIYTLWVEFNLCPLPLDYLISLFFIYLFVYRNRFHSNILRLPWNCSFSSLAAVVFALNLFTISLFTFTKTELEKNCAVRFLRINLSRHEYSFSIRIRKTFMSLSSSIIKPSSSTLIYEKSFVFRASFVIINNQRLHRYPHDAMDIIQRHKQRRSFLISRLLMAPKMSITLRNGMRITTKQFWNMKSIVLHSLHVEHWCFERVTENVGGTVPFQQYHGLSKGESYYIRFKYTQRSDLIEWHVIDSWCCSCFWRVSLQRRKKKKTSPVLKCMHMCCARNWSWLNCHHRHRPAKCHSSMHEGVLFVEFHTGIRFHVVISIFVMLSTTMHDKTEVSRTFRAYGFRTCCKAWKSRLPSLWSTSIEWQEWKHNDIIFEAKQALIQLETAAVLWGEFQCPNHKHPYIWIEMPLKCIHYLRKTPNPFHPTYPLCSCALLCNLQ